VRVVRGEGEVTAIGLRFTEHAIDRMLDWNVEPDEVVAVVTTGEVVEEYEDGSTLLLGRRGVRPLHVVVSRPEEDTTVVITVYEPSPLRWDPGFRTRRPQ
jgi:hypothetical protein